MTDGPHRILPLPRQWQRVAERAANLNYTSEDVALELRDALYKDAKELPVRQLMRVLGEGGQQSLFHEYRLDLIESSDLLSGGTALRATFQTMLVASILEGSGKRNTVQSALAATLKERAFSMCRSIEQHYLLELGCESSIVVRERLLVVIKGCDIEQLTVNLIGSHKKPPLDSKRRKRRRGLDEGPHLLVI